MKSDTRIKNTQRSRIHIAFPWLIVLQGALLLLISNINGNTFGVFFKPIAEEFGWNRGAVAGSLGIRALIAGIFTLPMGYLADRYGPRRVLLPSYLFIGVGFLLYSKVTNIWQLYLVQSLLIGIAASAPFVCVMSTVAKWHTKRPGLALGITSAGTGLSSLIFPPIAIQLIGSIGWHHAMIVLGLITITVAVPVSFFIKDPPLTKEQRDGKSNKYNSPFAVWRILPKLLKNRVFLSIVMIFLLFYIAVNLLITHLVNYVTDIGISAIIAASMVSVMGVVSTIGRLGMGAISDRLGTKVDTVVCCISVILSLLLLMLKIPILMWIAVGLFGIGFGGMAPLIPAIIGDYFKWRNLSTLTGAAMMGTSLGAAIGPWIGGFIFDISNSYFWALVLSSVLTIIALAIVIHMPPARAYRDSGQVLL